MPTLSRISRTDITERAGDREVIDVTDLVDRINSLIDALNSHNEALDEVKEFFDMVDSAAREASSDVSRIT